MTPRAEKTLWGLTPDVLAKNWANGYARVSNWKAAKKTGTVQYLTSGTIAKIESGDIEVTGLSEDGHVQGFLRPDVEITQRPKRVWHLRSHNAETGGTNVLAKLVPNRRFDYCKSLYAVEDTVRFAVADKRDALVLDFFSGSGTTAHAVMRLNKQDGGRRRSISVTNNEVSVDEHKSLSQKSLRQGDPQDGEALGICDYITRPRIQAAITGLTPAGELIKGDYKFTDEFPMADGFEENVGVLHPDLPQPATGRAGRGVHLHRAIALDACWRPRSPDRPAHQHINVADTYAVLFELDHSSAFIHAVEQADGLRVAYIVADNKPQFQAVAAQLPEGIKPVRLYESYLRTFQINTERA